MLPSLTTPWWSHNTANEVHHFKHKRTKCRRCGVAGIGTIVAAVSTQATVAGHSVPQVVLPHHTDLPSAAALQVKDPLRLNHAHSSVMWGFWLRYSCSAPKYTREAKLVNIVAPLPPSAWRVALTSSLRDLPGVLLLDQGCCCCHHSCHYPKWVPTMVPDWAKLMTTEKPSVEPRGKMLESLSFRSIRISKTNHVWQRFKIM